MALYISRFLIVLFFADLTWARWSSVGSTETFTFVTSKTGYNDQILWYLNKQNGNDTLFKCGIFIGTQCEANNMAPALYSANFTSNSTSSTSVLTIKFLTPFQHNTILFCEVEFSQGLNKTSAQYNLYIFAAAESPTCDVSPLLNGSNLQINCLTQKVFPGSICKLYIQTNESGKDDLMTESITYKHDQNATTGYYKTNCTYTVSAAILEPGSYQFRVIMYPNITSNITVEMKTTSNYTLPINLYYPKALLKADCQINNFVKEHLKSNCTCYNNNTSILPTTVIWSNGTETLSLKETLEFEAIRNKSFQCILSNNLKWTDSINFQPNVSYPPEEIIINLLQQDMDLCKDTKVEISGRCIIYESNPDPSVYVNIDNTLMEIKSSTNKREYRFIKTMTSTGIFNFSCFANSTAFSSTASNITITVTINGPPSIPTIFKKENLESNVQLKNVFVVTKMDTITCQSKGGYPQSKNLSLICGEDKTNATNQDEVNLRLNITSNTNVTCECFVWHESKCLQNTTTAQFKFIVVDAISDPHSDFKTTYIGIGVAAACIVVIITSILITSYCIQRKLNKSSSDMTENLVKNEDLYFIKEDSTPS